MFEFNKTIKFVADFSSPILGNVWVGRIVTLPKKQAIKFIEAGVAQPFVEQHALEPKPVEIKKEESQEVEDAASGESDGGEVTPENPPKRQYTRRVNKSVD